MRIANSLKTIGVVALVGALLVANQFIFNDGFNFSVDEGSTHASHKKNHKSIQLSGSAATETRELGSFSRIKVGGAYNIKLVKGTKAGISLTGDSEVLKHISTDVSDGTLQIKLDGNIRGNNGDIDLVITYDKLNSIRLSGANELTADHVIVTDKLDLDIAGASKATLEVQADAVSTEVHGAGDISLKGKTKSYVAEVHGAGEIEAYELQAERVKVQLSGAGHANVYASQDLDARVSGAGQISYKGKPANKKLKNSGMSSIIEG